MSIPPPQAAHRPIFLIGFPACGKSTLGNALARALPHSAFIDLDNAVEERAGMTIAQIFARHGEPAFRRMENEALADACRTAGTIVACGGGTPCRQQNMDKMLAAGTVVWLQAPDTLLIRRLRQAPAGQRPMFDQVINDDSALEQYMEQLRLRRQQHYCRANAVFDASDLDTGQGIARSVKKFVEQFIPASEL